MLDFLGTVATAALIVFVISTLLVFMAASRGAKLWLAALLGLWVGIAAAGSAAGWAATARPFPIMGIFVATPLVAAALATAWPSARRAMLSLPLSLLVGLNIGRVFAVLFLLLAAARPAVRSVPAFGRLGRYHHRRRGPAPAAGSSATLAAAQRGCSISGTPSACST